MTKPKTTYSWTEDESVRVPTKDWTNNILNVIIADTEYNKSYFNWFRSIVKYIDSKDELRNLCETYELKNPEEYEGDFEYQALCIRLILKDMDPKAELRNLSEIYNPENPEECESDMLYIRFLMEEAGIEDNFLNYLIVKEDGWIDSYVNEAHYPDYPHLDYGWASIDNWFDCERPENEAELTRLQDDVAEEIHEIFENPKIRRRTVGKIFKREIENVHISSIYPYNTILVAERIFEEPVVSALNYLGIEKKLHYSPRLPSLF